MPTDKPFYFCPNCNALYEIVKVKAGPESEHRRITCQVCSAPFPARDGKFVFKYLMLRKAAAHIRKSKRR